MLFTCLYKYKRLQGSQGSACPKLESNTPVAHVPKASRGQGMSPPPVSSNLGFILCRLRGIAFSNFSTHPPENLTHDTCKPNVHATCGKYIKGKCMQSETVCLTKSKSPKSTGEYESDVFHRFNRFKTFHHGCNRHKFLIMWFIILMMMPTISAPTTRGSDSGSSLPSVNDIMPNTQRDYDFLPGMKRWNGIPFNDFLRVWWVALCLALGTISMDGVTLLTNAEGNDPHASSSDADEKRKYDQRCMRVFCCIMNYIKTNSRCARIANTEFKNDGPGLFKWLQVWGNLENDPETKAQLLNEWEESSMSKVGIKNNDPEGIWKWLEYLEELSEKIQPGGGKSLPRCARNSLMVSQNGLMSSLRQNV